MRTAVIADIHGHHEALLAVLSDIAAAGCDRIICLGDVVEGGQRSADCIRELMSRGIATVLGNHDELHAQLHRTPESEWLGALPAAITEGDVVHTHISPRNDDRAIKDRYTAWSVLDDTTQRIAFVGHAHIPAVYGWRGAAVGAARQLQIEYGRPIPLEADDRYIICPGSVAPGRDGDPLPRYAVFDDAAVTIEIRRVAPRADGPPREVVIFIGLPASGKSTFYRERFAATHAHISKDNFPNNRRPQRRQMQLLEEALAQGRDVVVDNTNPRRADRAELIAAARARGARVVGYYFSSTVDASLARNAGREGRQRIADVGILATAKSMERPSPAEGFDALHHVRLLPGGGFDVQPWRDDPPHEGPKA